MTRHRSSTPDAICCCCCCFWCWLLVVLACCRCRRCRHRGRGGCSSSLSFYGHVHFHRRATTKILRLATNLFYYVTLNVNFVNFICSLGGILIGVRFFCSGCSGSWHYSVRWASRFSTFSKYTTPQTTRGVIVQNATWIIKSGSVLQNHQLSCPLCTP